jgi:hypothetical protein
MRSTISLGINHPEEESPVPRKSKQHLIKDILWHHNQDNDVYLDYALDELWIESGLEAVLNGFSYELLEALLDRMALQTTLATLPVCGLIITITE